MANIRERVTRDGTKSFHITIRKKGYPTQAATFKRRNDALQWVREIEGDITAGRSLKNSEAKKHTLAAAINRFCATVAPNKSDEQNLRRLLKWWRDEYGGRLLSEVNTALVVEARDRLASGKYVRAKPLKPANAIQTKAKTNENAKEYPRAPATVNRYLAALSVVLARCCGEWSWCDDNAVRRVKKMKEPRGRVRFLTDKERKTLLDKCAASDDETLYPVVVIALSTGARHGEIVSLRWSNVNLKKGAATLDETKNGDRPHCPLPGMPSIS